MRKLKATINVKKASQYAKFNGKEYEVKDSYLCKGLRVYSLIGLDNFNPKNTTDFTEKELKNIH